jgi:hypothetical protein
MRTLPFRLSTSRLAPAAALVFATLATLAAEGTSFAQPPPDPAAPPADPAAAPPAPPAAPATPAPLEPCAPGQTSQPDKPCEAQRSTTEPPGGVASGNTTVDDKATASNEDMKSSSIGIRELEDQSYWFLGFRFRDFIIPKFMINLFVEGGATVNAIEFGPELTYRRGPLELDMHLGYADYSMDNFMFKEKDDPDRAYEKASSDMKLLVASIDIMANIPIDKEGRFQFLIGGDVGVAGVLGELKRAQAFPKRGTSASPDRPEDWGECTGASTRYLDESGSPYCDASNDHYKGYSEPSLANGGGKPFIVPYLSLPHVALRAKPLPDTQLRLDAGFSITGFFFGLGAGYRLPI